MMQAERTITAVMPQSISAEEKPTVRIAAYCRVSTDSKDQEQSFAAQVKYYNEFIQKIPNSVLTDIYADDAVSGRRTEKREEFRRLIEDCKKGKIDRVITKSVSRFARNTIDCLQTVRALNDLGVSVLFEKEQIDTAKMPSEILLAMSGTQAQDESISHGNNMKWSYQQRMKKGDFLGCRPCYGYDLVDSGTFVINEEEAKVVRLIADLYLSGMGKKKIADTLNTHGIKNKNGKPWEVFAVDYVLNNERYIGDALLQKKISTAEYPPKRIRNKGIQDQYYVENALPFILTKQQREAILMLQKHRKTDMRGAGGHQLSKILRCSECGHIFRRVTRKNDAVWQCAHRVCGKTNCTLYTLHEDDVCTALIHAVNKLILNRELLLLPLISQLGTMQSKINGSEIKIYKIDQEIAELSRQSLVMTELLTQSILDPADFSAQNTHIAEQISALRAKRRELLRQNQTDDLLNDLRELNEILGGVESELTDYDEELIRSVINHITVQSDTELNLHLHGGLTVTEYLPKYYNGRRNEQ